MNNIHYPSANLSTPNHENSNDDILIIDYIKISSLCLNMNYFNCDETKLNITNTLKIDSTLIMNEQFDKDKSQSVNDYKKDYIIYEGKVNF